MFFIELQVLNILWLHFHSLITVCLLLAPGSNKLCFLVGKKSFSFLYACMFNEKRKPKNSSYLWLEENFHWYPWEVKSFSVKHNEKGNLIHMIPHSLFLLISGSICRGCLLSSSHPGWHQPQPMSCSQHTWAQSCCWRHLPFLSQEGAIYYFYPFIPSTSTGRWGLNGEQVSSVLVDINTHN